MMAYSYDPENIFAKILRGEIPNSTVLESYDHFATEATDAEIVGYTRAVGEVCKMLGVDLGSDGAGFRMIANAGKNGVQDVPHLHVHILAGRPLGPMIKKA